MQPLSATECITPAIDRTRLVLFTPFRAGRTWKLCATAYVCCLGTMFFPFPLVYLAFFPAVRSKGSLAVAGLFAGVLLGTAFFTWIFHLCSRLQFAYLDIIVNRGEFVAPAWRKYGPQSRPWSGFKMAFGAASLLIGAVPLIAYIRHVMPVFVMMSSLKPGQPPPPQFMAAIFAGYGVLFLIYGPLFLIHTLLADFIVPSLALENTGIKEAFRRLGELIRREAGEFALYVLLKTVLGIAGYICSTILAEIVILLGTLIVGLIVFFFGFLLHLAGVPTAILIILGVSLAVIWYIGAIGYSLMLFIGPFFTFLTAYSVYFLGGRYPALGDLLDRSTPPPPSYPMAYPVYQPPPNPAL
jgi:hypothetical protein